MNKKRKIVLFAVLFPFLFIGVYVILAYAFSRTSASQKVFEGEKNKVIYVHSNGVHLDIALPIEDVEKSLRDQFKLHDNTAYLSFGWGDKGFYLETPEWSDLKTSVAFRAMFLPSETAMHVTRYKEMKSHWKEVKIGEEQLKILNQYIQTSFTMKENAIIEIENAGYYENDAFYEAEKSYHLIRTCNMWVNNALKEIGVPTCVWCPFDWGVLEFLED